MNKIIDPYIKINWINFNSSFLKEKKKKKKVNHTEDTE